MELTRRHSGIRVAPSRKAFVIINTVVLLLISAIMLYPAIYVIAASFSEETAILRGDVFLYPVRAHLKAYQKVFVYPMLWKSYSNTLLYTVLGTAINLILTVFGAWALSQKKMVGRRFFTLMCTFTMFFGGGMIPTFLVVKGLGLLNTIWGILLPGAVSTYNMILMRTFFRQIPESLVEAAELDGCKDFGVLFRIVLPLSLASLMTIGMFYAGTLEQLFPGGDVPDHQQGTEPAADHPAPGGAAERDCGKCQQYGERDGGGHQIRHHRGGNAADAVHLSLCAAVFCEGRYDRLREGVS